jgi:hypothetical protein
MSLQKPGDNFLDTHRVADSAIAERLDTVLELRDLVEQLEAVELPRGFGRD